MTQKIKGASGVGAPETPENSELFCRRSNSIDTTAGRRAQDRVPDDARPIYHGRQRIGFIAARKGCWAAWLLDGRPLGAFTNNAAAIMAIKFPPVAP